MIVVDTPPVSADLYGRLDELLDRITIHAATHGYPACKRGHGDSYMCSCPAHDDRNPSLAIRLEGDRVLIHCFAGCTAEQVAAAVNFPMAALFSDWEPAERGPKLVRWRRDRQDRQAAAEEAVKKPPPLPPAIHKFLSLEFPPVDPILGPINTQQLIMLYAPAGVGKTMFALALAHAMSTGADFVGWVASRAARVLYIDGEMSGEMMQTRLNATRTARDWLRIANLANWAALHDLEPVNLCEEAGHEIVAWWADQCRSDVIILDNLMSLAWMDGVSMSSDEYWQPIRRFCVAQRALGRTVIVVDHTNASGDIFGTKTKMWHSDLAIRLSQIGDGNDGTGSGTGVLVAQPKARFSLSFAKVRVPRDSGTRDTEDKIITIGQVGQNWEWDCGVEERVRQAREMRRNDLTIREIAEELGASKSAVARWVKGVKP